MKVRPGFLLFFSYVILVTVFFCCSNRLYTPENFTGKQLVFGEGGGFSGQVIEYTLLENGQLFMTNSLSKETRPIKKISKGQVRSLFDQAERSGMDTLNFNHPGNLFYFIRMKVGAKNQEITWGSRDHQVPETVQNLYQLLSAHANQKR